MSNLHYIQKQRQIRERQSFNAAMDLTCRAYDRLLVTLTRSGNVINDKHRDALMTMLSYYSFLAIGQRQGRWAFDLSVGGAKSQSVIAWCATLNELQQQPQYKKAHVLQNVSVLITAGKVEALCDTKRDMIAAGVPEASIGLWHTYQYKPEHAIAARRGAVQPTGNFASEPSIDDEDPKYGDPLGAVALTSRQFCLIAHNRLRGWYRKNVSPTNGLDKNELTSEAWLYYCDPVTGDRSTRTLAIPDEAMLTSTCSPSAVRNFARPSVRLTPTWRT
jgi:hypothetical protein